MARQRARAALLRCTCPVPQGIPGRGRTRSGGCGRPDASGPPWVHRSGGVHGAPAGERTQGARKSSQGNTRRVRGAAFPGGGHNRALLRLGISRISASGGNAWFIPVVSRKAGEEAESGSVEGVLPGPGQLPVGERAVRGGRRTPCERDLTVRNRPTAGHGGPRRSMMARPPNRRRHSDFSTERRLKAEWKRISLVWNTFDAIGPARGRLAGPTQCDVRWTHATRGVL